MTPEAALSVEMPFGKHKGKTLEEIADADVLYLDWLVGQEWLRGDLKECVETVCESRAREIESKLGD